ncbi:MAG: prepilin-type N-terminal cleavage/methylation domain-containing protein [Rhodospirillales bacterium]|nr:prepilin-type N-terminal cleavage/methylation domain-containing protein [Acetobacter sp.]
MTRQHGGFTLLEVLIAVAIASLALAMLFGVTTESLRATHVAARYAEAMSRARSHMDGASAYLVAGEQHGDDGGGYHWRVRTELVGTTAKLDAAGKLLASSDRFVAQLYAVAVWITWREGRGERSVRLDTKRLVSEAPKS